MARMKMETAVLIVLVLTSVAYGLNSWFVRRDAGDDHRTDAEPGQLDTASTKPDLASSGTRSCLASSCINPGAGVYDVTGWFIGNLPVTRVTSSASGFEAGWDGRNATGCRIAPGACCVRITSDDIAKSARLSTSR